MKNFLFVFIVGFIVVSCNKDKTTPFMGDTYFPNKVGYWVEYEVDSMYHNKDLSPKSDTFNYLLREEITEQFVDNEGRLTSRIERYTRPNQADSWTISAVWYSNLLDSRAERVENNQRIVKLVFPMRKGKTWDGNAYNVFDYESFEYEKVNYSGTVNDLIFDSLVYVNQIENKNFIEHQDFMEIFAAGIGLVYKREKDLEISFGDSTNIDRGYELYQKVTSYGIN